MCSALLPLNRSYKARITASLGAHLYPRRGDLLAVFQCIRVVDLQGAAFSGQSQLFAVVLMILAVGVIVALPRGST